MKYSELTVSEEDAKRGLHKSFLGGGATHWDKRGEFQLKLLQTLGLNMGDKLFDVGCGPLRGGVHLIRYLDDHGYVGIDYNEDFIKISRQTVEEHPDLAAKHPRLEVIKDFDFRSLNTRFNFILAFSVLNHCSWRMRRTFFANLSRVVSPVTRIYITHASWPLMPTFYGQPFKISRKIRSADEIAPGIRTEDWGWPSNESIFPILEVIHRK